MPTLNWEQNVRKPFRLRPTVVSHGWYEVPPMDWDESTHTFYAAERVNDALYLVSVLEAEVTRTHVRLHITAHGPKRTQTIQQVLDRRLQTILKLKEDLSEFYRLCRSIPHLRSIPRRGAGRIIRGSNLFDDVVKGICGTNVAWKQAVKMMHRLASIGPSHPLRPTLHAFPTPDEIVRAGMNFLRDEVRLGYRADTIMLFAQQAAKGDPVWTHLAALDGSASSDDYFRAFTRVKGIGKATAHYLLCLAGHYDRLGVDSAVLNYCQEHYFDGRKPKPAEVEALFERFGEWKALVWWFEFWQYYIDRNPPPAD